MHGCSDAMITMCTFFQSNLKVIQGLTLSPTDPVFKLITSTPSFAGNPVGKATREAIVSKVKGSLSRDRSVFYPHYSPSTYEHVIPSTPPSRGWPYISEAILCQSICEQVSGWQDELDRSKIDSVISDCNNEIQPTLVGWYTTVILPDFMKFDGNHEAAKETYKKQIDSDHWVTLGHQSWELFHHWVKLSALGASDAEIATLIQSLKTRGLNIPTVVDADSWRKYFVWFNNSNSNPVINHLDIDSAARGAELAEKSDWIPAAAGSGNFPTHETIRYNTEDFVDHCDFQAPVSDSCFTADTQVLMADGSLRPIEEVKVGDVVETPKGMRKVLLVSTPKRGNRYLYRVNNLPFCFTETHPFLNYSESPRYLAVSPLALLQHVPRLGQDGIGHLKEGAELLTKDRSMVTVKSLQREEPGNADESLYDLIVEPDTNGRFSYYVGCGDMLIAVASEVSTFGNHTESELLSFAVIMRMIANSSEKLNFFYESTSHETFLKTLTSAVRTISTVFLQNTKKGRVSGKGAETDLQTLITTAAKFSQRKDGSYNRAGGLAYEHFMQGLFVQLASSLEHGYRVIPENITSDSKILVLTVMDICLKDSAPKVLSKLSTLVSVFDYEPVCEVEKLDQSSMYSRQIHKMFYFSLRDKEEITKIRIELYSHAERRVMLTAETFLHLKSPRGYEYQRLRLFDVNHTEYAYGYINVDLRIMSRDELKMEEENAREWNQASKREMSIRIQDVCEQLLAALCKEQP